IVTERPKAKVSIKPDQHVFRGETVTLRCDIDGEGVTSWKYSWYKDGSDSVFSELQEHTFSSVTESDAGKYSCYGAERGGSRTSNISDEVTLTVSDEAKTLLSVSPQKWLTEGDPVTLICEVKGSSTGWTFSWYTLTASSDSSSHYQLLSDSSRGAGGNYTVSSAAPNHTGVYVCRAKREKPVYNTWYSNKQLLWVTGVSPPVSLIISPSRTQHFTSVSLSLSCEDQSNSDRWRVRRYTDNEQLEDCSSSLRGSQTGSKCTISSTITSDTGVYWCQSESGENYHPVNITIHFDVILESPVHPVTEGDSLTLRCLYKHSPNLRAGFYKDGSLIQSQTTEMIISTVSKSHEGFYYCKHPEREESPKSWISVTERPKAKVSIKPDQHVFRGETVTLRCDIDGEGVTSWKYSWYKDGSDSVFSELQEQTFSSVTESDAGKYSCYGAERGGSRTSHISDAVTLTVSDQAKTVLSVSPQKWLTEGDPVTLICEVKGSSTGWTFRWYTLTASSDSSNHYQLLSDSSRGAGGNYTVSSAALNHTGVYVCRAERGKPAYNTTYSNTQPLWVTGVSPPVSLIISPNRTQHFISVSLSLSCEDQSNSDRWRVRRYTDKKQLEDCSSSRWGSQTGSKCTINSTKVWHTGVYWCQSESGEISHHVNITVHSESIFLYFISSFLIFWG
uniref:Ig-like domain-containing protein n=1 Tax=Cyprinus carpio TaxID=7962 RepID=A0A8C1J1T1_CYPCA